MLTIKEINSKLVVDSRLVAVELGINHKGFLQTIKKYLKEIEEFGTLEFEMREFKTTQGNTCTEIYYYLNEDQATYVMTLSRNTEKVRYCKRSLVKAFKEAKTQLNAKTKFALPQTYKEALLALVAKEEEIERIAIEKQLLEEENHQLSEQLDELFDYSSIIRIAKFNNISETNFNWRKLKAASLQMQIEIKQVPDPRFGTKNIYSHQVWRYCYPEVKLPETTTLVIKNN